MRKVPVSIRQEWYAELGWEGYSCVTKAAQSPSLLLSLHISYHEEVLGEPPVPPAVWTAALRVLMAGVQLCLQTGGGGQSQSRKFLAGRGRL